MAIILFAAQIASAKEFKIVMKAPEILNYGLSVDLPELARKDAYDSLSAALDLANVAALENLILSNVPVDGIDNGLNRDLDVLVLVTTRQQAEKILSTSAKGFFLSKDTDAFTMSLAKNERGPLVTFLFWDQLKFTEIDGKSLERADAFARITTALGRELFGNVIYLKRQMHQQKLISNKSVVANQDVLALTAGVSFIENLMKTSEKELPANIIEDFKSALDREKETLATWQFPSSKPVRKN
jgi:hypothetical protein